MAPSALDGARSSRAHHLPAAGLVVVGALAGTLLSLALGGRGLLVLVVVLQLALVAAWVVATGIRGSRGAVGLGVAATAGGDLAVLLPERPELDWLLPVLGLVFLAAVVHQMARPAPRRYLVASLAGVVMLLCAVGALAVLIGLERLDDGEHALGTALAAVGAALLVGHLVDLVLPRPQLAAGVPRGLLGLVLAVGAGVLVAVLRGAGGSPAAALPAVAYGAALGGVAALMALGASYVVVERAAAERAGWALPVVQVVLPLAAAAPIAYALAVNGTA